MGKTITVSTDDFDGRCEPPDPWPQDSSPPPLQSGNSGTQTGPRQKLSAGMGGVVSMGDPTWAQALGWVPAPSWGTQTLGKVSSRTWGDPGSGSGPACPALLCD